TVRSQHNWPNAGWRCQRQTFSCEGSLLGRGITNWWAESRRRAFPASLRRMVVLRDDTCRTPYCDGRIQDIDHATPHRNGGPTSWNNSSGLCAACNQIKENTGWTHQATPEHLSV